MDKNKTAKGIIMVPIIILLLILVFLLVAILGHSPSGSSRSRGDGWEVVSRQSYGSNSMGYRVYIDHIASENELREIFGIVTEDSYKSHTVWFYRDYSAADGSDAAWHTLEDNGSGHVSYK